ncbi:MAG: glycosyltransferase [Dehalococcoidia bacterium]|nr:MAG: glycosyltransferase [Dehalococcoidia bacterium]
MDKLALYPHLGEFCENLETFRRRNGLNYDLIFGHYWLSGMAGKTLAEWWGVPLVVMFHTLGAVKNAFGIGETEPALRLEAEKKLARSCQRIIAATDREKLDLVRCYRAETENIAVIPCGVNPAHFYPRKVNRTALGLSDGRFVLYAGRIEPLKGIDRLIKAMALLDNSLRLVIIGGDGQSQGEINRLRQLARELGLDDRVTFLGLIAHDNMPDFYRAASVLVVPSHYESFGMVALEALASGTPVVATDVGNMRNVIRQGETGYIIDGSPESIARSIDDLLAKPPDLQRTHKISVSVAHLSWGNIARDIIRECYRVIEEQPVSMGSR